MKINKLLGFVAASLLLVGCGGGNSESKANSSVSSKAPETSSKAPASSTPASSSQAPKSSSSKEPVHTHEFKESVKTDENFDVKKCSTGDAYQLSQSFGEELVGSDTKWNKGVTKTWAFANKKEAKNASIFICAKMSSSSHDNRKLFVDSSIGGTDNNENAEENNGKPRFNIAVNDKDVSDKMTTKTYGELGLTDYTYFELAVVDLPAGEFTFSITTNSTFGYRLCFDKDSEIRIVVKDYEKQPVVTGLAATFAQSDKATITVFKDAEYLEVDEGPKYYARTADGQIAAEPGTGNITFKVVPASGWFVQQINVEGEYDKIKSPADTDIENGYQITKISSDIAVSLTLTDKLEGYNVTFTVDPHLTLTVYTDKTYEKVDTEQPYQTRDGGLPSKDPENAQINFKVVPAENYMVDEILVTGTYKNVKLPGECGENCYRITKVQTDLAVTITEKGFEVPPAAEGYKATFVADPGVKEIHMYKDTDAFDNIDVYTVGTECLSTENGEPSKSGSAQINFVVVLNQGYEISDIVATSGTYKNFKKYTDEETYPTNGYRFTKVTGDMTITITTAAV